jgi:MFS family permease
MPIPAVTRARPPVPSAAPERRPAGPVIPGHPHYKWIVLSNTTLGTLLATINASIVLISLPAIFRGIGLNPLQPANVGYLLWMLMGYLVVTAVLVVPFGRLGDMYGRVRIYNIGFVIFTLAAAALSFDPFLRDAGAVWLIAWRVVQGIGGAMLMASSSAILTDAFPANQRGMALGVNMVAAVAGSFLGLLVGGVLSGIHWQAIFWVGVPLGIIGTLWSVRSLKELGVRSPGRIDWAGTAAFGLGLTVLLIGITYGIQPYRGHSTGWTNPVVAGAIGAGLLLLIADEFGGSRRAAVRAHHLAAGNLASPARLQLRVDPAVGRYLHAPDDRRFSDGRPARRIAVGPPRRPAVHRRRHGRDGGVVRRAGDDPGRLQLLALRRSHLPQRPRWRRLHRTQHGGHHVQRPSRPARRGVRCSGHLLQCRLVVVDRNLLLAHGRRPGPYAPVADEPRPATAGCPVRGG